MPFVENRGRELCTGGTAMITEDELATLRASRRIYHCAADVSGLNLRFERGTFYVSDAGGKFLCAIHKGYEPLVFELARLESLNGFGTVEALLKETPTLEELDL